uniref:Uncharacterized protein n=1 Tax=Helianthus annuus TaxID=4232 RepID=A0A251UUK7_HELAN
MERTCIKSPILGKEINYQVHAKYKHGIVVVAQLTFGVLGRDALTVSSCPPFLLTVFSFLNCGGEIHVTMFMITLYMVWLA